MRILIPVMGLAMALGPTICRAGDDYKQKTKTKVEDNGDVKTETKAHGKHGPKYKSRSKTKLQHDGDVKYKEKTKDSGGTTVTKEKIEK